MSIAARASVSALAAWTVFIWSIRIFNALGDAALDVGEKAFAVALSLSLLGLAAASVRAAWTGRGVGVIRVFATWTTLVWAYRITMILLAEHEVGFKVVHTILGLVSVVLAVLVYRFAVFQDTEPASSVS